MCRSVDVKIILSSFALSSELSALTEHCSAFTLTVKNGLIKHSIASVDGTVHSGRRNFLPDLTKPFALLSILLLSLECLAEDNAATSARPSDAARKFFTS